MALLLHDVIAGMDHTENTASLLLFMGHCLVTLAVVTPQLLL
jgi:hypothetical protein